MLRGNSTSTSLEANGLHVESSLKQINMDVNETLCRKNTSDLIHTDLIPLTRK